MNNDNAVSAASSSGTAAAAQQPAHDRPVVIGANQSNVTRGLSLDDSPLAGDVGDWHTRVTPDNPTGAQTTYDPKTGTTTFDNKNYTITASPEREGRATITNKTTGDVTEVWGDPHVNENQALGTGGANWDFHGHTTFVLDDGTTVDMQTEPGKAGDATFLETLTVVVPGGDNGAASYGMSVTGLHRESGETGAPAVTVAGSAEALEALKPTGVRVRVKEVADNDKKTDVWALETGGDATNDSIRAAESALASGQPGARGKPLPPGTTTITTTTTTTTTNGGLPLTPTSLPAKTTSTSTTTAPAAAPSLTGVPALDAWLGQLAAMKDTNGLVAVALVGQAPVTDAQGKTTGVPVNQTLHLAATDGKTLVHTTITTTTTTTGAGAPAAAALPAAPAVPATPAAPAAPAAPITTTVAAQSPSQMFTTTGVYAFLAMMWALPRPQPQAQPQPSQQPVPSLPSSAAPSTIQTTQV